MKSRRLLQSVAPLLVLSFLVLSFGEASARAGRSRSFGSRGTTSYRSTQPSAPDYGSNRSAQGSPLSREQPLGQGQQGGFLRGLAGGVLGGLVGGMLFRSLGFAGAGSGLGGGVGLFDIALLAGGGYLLYRWISSRRRPAAVAGSHLGNGLFGGSPGGGGWLDAAGSGGADPSRAEAETFPAFQTLGSGLSRIRESDPRFDEGAFREMAQDVFFRIQGAWTRRDLGPVAGLMGDEVRRYLQTDVDDMKQRGEVNRLENIAVREVEIVEASQDQGQDVVTVRLLANLLDYWTDEAGQLRSGSDFEPVKFEEYWTFSRPAGARPWLLTAIQQA